MINVAALDRAVKIVIRSVCWGELKVIELGAVITLRPTIVREYHRQLVAEGRT